MSEPVRLSDELVLAARLIAELSERSIAAQIEFWAQLGRAIEPFLGGSLALRLTGAEVPLSDCLATVDSAEGRRRVAKYLDSLPFPHYEAAPGGAGLLVRVDKDGTRTLGRFVDRQFREMSSGTDS